MIPSFVLALCWESAMWEELVTVSALMLGVLEDRGYSTGWKEVGCWCLSCGGFPPLSVLKDCFYLLRRRWKGDGDKRGPLPGPHGSAAELSFHQKRLIHRVSILLSWTLPWQKCWTPTALQRVSHTSLKNVSMTIHFDIIPLELGSRFV